MKAIYDLSSIMSRAHAIRCAAALEMSCRPSEVLWSECLRMAWAEARAAAAPLNASRVADEWAALCADDEKLEKFLERAVRHAAKNTIRYARDPNKYSEYNDLPAFGYGEYTDKRDLMDAACEKIICQLNDLDTIAEKNRALAFDGKAPLSLWSIGWHAGQAAIAQVSRAYCKHACASVRVVQDADGDDIDALELCGDHGSAAAEAEMNILLEQFMASRDEIDRAIIRGLMARETYAVIGKKVGISAPGVCYRAKQIRAAIVAMSA